MRQETVRAAQNAASEVSIFKAAETASPTSEVNSTSENCSAMYPAAASATTVDISTIILKEFNFLCWLLFPQLNPIPQITLFIFCAKLSPCLRRFLSQVHYWSLTNCSRKTREHLGEASLLRGGQPTYRHWRGPAAGEFAFTGLEINFMEISPPQIFKIIPMKIKLRGMMLGR